MIRKLCCALALVVAATTASHAGVNLMCEGEGIEADFPLAGGTGFSLLSAGVWVGDKETRREGDKGLVGGVPFHATWLDDRIYIDLADSNYERVLVRVRLFSAVTSDVIAGIIDVVDVDAYAVTCSVG